MLKIYLTLFAIVGVHTRSIDGESSFLPTICTQKVLKQCGLSMCTELNHVECFHGHCNNVTGACECEHCWAGENCNSPENLHVPSFKQGKIEVEFQGDPSHVTTLKASDPDSEQCIGHDCHCSTVLYAIEDGNDDSMFMIDPFTGIISFSQALPEDVDKIRRTLKISAQNPIHSTRHARSVEDESSSSVELVINFPEVHSRKRRSSPSSMPNDPTFLLEKLDSFTGVTSLNIGDKVPMKLSIWLPDQSYDMHVELLTPYESSAILTICDPVISHVGSNYDSAISESVTTLDANAGDKRWDRAVIDFGSVSNSGSDAVDADQSKIIIDFSVVLVDNNATQDGESYTISAGVAYNTEVWIGQVAFTAVLDHDSWLSPSPSVLISGPTEIYQDTSALFLVDMIIREYASDIRLDIMTESETEPIMSVCSMSVGAYGDSYGCLSKDLPHFQSPNVSAEYNVTASFDFGSITNAGKRSREEDDDVADTITVQVAVYLSNSTEVVDGKTYWLGASLTVDNEHIHSNQFAVTALANQGATLTQEPAFEFFAADGNDVLIEGHIGFIVTITIAEDSTSSIIMDLSMPDNDPAVFTICSAEVYYVGHNFPCVGTVTPSYSLQDGINTDYVQFNFGRVTNVGRRSESEDSTIKIRVVAKMLLAATSGSSYMVTAGVRYELADQDVLWVGQSSITASESMPQDYSDDATKTPTIELFNRAEDNYIYKNAGLSFNIDLNVPSSTTFSPFSLTLGVPENENDPLFSVCIVQVATIGGSFPCYAADQFIIAENGLDAVNIATITLEPFTNPVFETPLNADDNKVIFEVHLKLKDHPSISSGDQYNISVALNYGQQTVNSEIEFEVTFTEPEYTEENEDPQFELTLDWGRVSALVVGETAVYTMVVYTPISSASTYSVDVVAENNTLSVCRAEILSHGKNIPCLDSPDKASYFSYEEDGLVDRGYLDLGAVRNTGIEPTVDGEDNYMVAQIVVRLDDEVDTQSFDVTVATGLSNMWSTTRNVTLNADPSTRTTYGTSPAFNFTKAKSFSTTKGGAAAFNLDIYIPFKAINNYSLEFHGLAHTATVCEARVISSGWNIPCVNGSFFTTIYNSSVLGAFSDIAYLDAGVITNMEWNDGDIEFIENMVQVQLIVRVEANSTVVDGETIDLNGTVKVDGSIEFDESQSFTVLEGFNDVETNAEPIFAFLGPTENFTSNSLDPVFYTVGQKQTFTINITTPVITTNMKIRITLPVAVDEAYLTITNVTLMSVGKNYACFQFYELDPIYNSTFGTSQKDSVIIDLGVITNLGTSHYYQYEDALHVDDEILIDVEIQLADYYTLQDQQLLEFNLTFDYSKDRQTTITQLIQANVTDVESPDLDHALNMPDYDPMELNQGDVLLVNLTVEHTNMSSAHAFSIIVNFMVPYYIEIEDSVEIEGYSMCTEITDDGIQFQLEEMFFTDVLTFYFNFSIDPERTMPMGLGIINTTIPIEVIYYKRDSLDGSGNIALGQVYKTQTSVVSLPFSVRECTDVLGMESSSIQDCQLSASSSLNDSYIPVEARIGSNGWAAGIRYYEKEYIQVRFGWMHRFSIIEIQGDSRNASIAKFSLSYTKEFVIWNDYYEQSEIKVFVNDFNTSDPDPRHSHSLMNPFDAIAIRIHPKDVQESTDISFRLLKFELYGCERAESLSPSTACPTDDTPDFGQYDRGVLVDPISRRIFVCVLEEVDQPKRCSYSDDNGDSWEEEEHKMVVSSAYDTSTISDVDDNIANVLAILNSTREIYGVSQNNRVLMRSDDYGNTWYTVTSDSYNQYLANDVPMAKAVEIPNDLFPGNEVQLNFTSVSGADLSIKADNTGLSSQDTDGNWQMIGRWTVYEEEV